ncbi:hypothetical protein IF650_03165 [Cellulosimicrobium terreum]|nr:hypothetical protein [Cellulosimicrobium terreum]
MARPSSNAPEVLPDGSLRAPDGVVYRRTPQRVTRRIGRDLIAAGADVVTDIYPEGLVYWTGAPAVSVWNEIEPALVVGRPPPVRDIQWVGHVWRSDDGEELLRLDGAH